MYIKKMDFFSHCQRQIVHENDILKYLSMLLFILMRISPLEIGIAVFNLIKLVIVTELFDVGLHNIIEIMIEYSIS